MALTKISGDILDSGVNVAGIVTATSFDGPFIAGAGNSGILAGIITATELDLNGNVDISGNLTVHGDQTTLNTTLREVELLRVDANSSETAGIITQTNSGDILKLYDGTTEVFTVTGIGSVGINEDQPKALLHVATDNGQTLPEISASFPLIVTKNSNSGIAIIAKNDAKSILAFGDTDDADRGKIQYVHTSGTNVDSMQFLTAGGERFRITSGGQVSISGAGTTFGNNTLLNIAPANRTTAFDASDGDTWHDVVIKQGASATTNSVGIAFEVSPSAYHKNAGTGIVAIKDGNNFDYGTHLAFVTRPHTAVAEERVRISSDGDVGINNSNPAYPLDIRHVGGNLNQTPIIRLFQSTDGCHNALTLESSTSVDKNIGIQFKNRNAVRGGIGYIQNDKIRIYTGTNANVAAQGLTINASGLVGIGEADPAYPLEVVGDGGGSFAASTNSTNGVLSVVGKNSAGSISAISRIKSYPDTNSNQSHMAFETRNSSNAMVEAIRINSVQQVGIGTVSPSEKLHITVPGNQRQTMLRLQHIGQRNFYIQGQWGSTDIGGANGILQFVDGGHLGFRVGSSGKVDMMLDQAGKVGINTDNPKAVLHARHDNTTNASTTFGATCGQILESEDSELAFGLQNSSPYPYYIQARTRVNTARDITLNPAGGAVAVGTNNSFSRKLNVKGTIGALSPSQTTALDFEADDGQNTYISSYHASGSNLYIRTNYSGVGVQNRVHIYGNGQLDTFGTSAGNPLGITIRNQNTANYSHARLRLESQNAAKYANIYADVPNDALRLEYNSSNSVYIKETGRVGIQTSNPQSALHVRGSGGIRIDPLADTNIVSNANVVTDGGGNPYLSGTPWYQTSPYLYNTGNSPNMDYYWIKIVESFGYSTIAYVEYMCHSDSNYPRSVHGRIDFAKYGPHSINISHNTITPLTGITPQLVIDSNKRVWIKMNGAQWNSDFRFRMIYGESINLNSDFTIGTDNNSAATGKMLDQDATPLNASGIIEPGATFRWDLGTYTNPPVYWNYTNVSSTSGTYGDGIQDYGSGQSHFNKVKIKGRLDIKAGWENHGLLVESNFIGSGNIAQPLLAAFTSQKNTVLQLDRKHSQGTILDFKYNGSSVGSISDNSSSLPSDRNYKKDITNLTLGLDLVNKLQPVSYHYKFHEDTSPVMYGLIAQDVETALNDVGVSQNKAAILQYEEKNDEKDSDYALDYVKLTPILINAVKELSTEIDKLKAEIAALKSS